MDDGRYEPSSIEKAPWLIITHENQTQTTFCTIPSPSPNTVSYIKTFPTLDGKSILGSCLGWLILRDQQNPTICSIWNPVTLQSIHLPRLIDAPVDKPRCILTSALDEYDSDANLLLFFPNGVVFFCRPTMGVDCKWVKQNLEYDGSIVDEITSLVTLNGDIYAYARTNAPTKYVFAKIKLAKDGLDSTLIFEPILIKNPAFSIKLGGFTEMREYLVEAGDVLYDVHIIIRHIDDNGNYDILGVFVYSLDLPNLEWIRIESLGDRAFLLGEDNCTWCLADTSLSNTTGCFIERDCIYLLSNLKSPTVHSYRLWDNSYTYLLPHSNFLDSYDSSTWFVNRNVSAVQEEKIQSIEKVKYIDETDGEVYMVDQLPPDMLISIVNRLHLFAYMNLRATSKFFRTEFSPPKWRERDGSLAPLFMSLKSKKGICELYDPYEAISHTITAPCSQTSASMIEFCKDGWLLLRIDGDSLQYFNPYTKEKGEYPRDEMTMIGHVSYAFSTCPNSSDCITIGFEAYSKLYISIFQAGREEWEDCFFEDIEFFSNFNSSPKYHNGAFYFLGTTGTLGVFKMVDGKWNFEVHDSPLTDDAHKQLNSSYLVELSGQLLSVLIQQFGKKVRVFRFDILAKSWLELYDLGDHILFLSPASTFSVLTKESKMRNRIYLQKRIGNGIVYYSLSTRKYYTSDTTDEQDFLDDFHSMRVQPFSCWI